MNESCSSIQNRSKNNQLIIGFGFGQPENNFLSNSKSFRLTAPFEVVELEQAYRTLTKLAHSDAENTIEHIQTMLQAYQYCGRSV